jgi:glyoxylase-like metal-dependent hydrolase (beta-lactamase superfamily II)
VSETKEPPPHRPLKQEQQPASDEVTEVGPGVLRLQIPILFTGLGHVNCYALLDDRGATLVDAGMPGRATWLALSARLKDAGLKIRDIHTVIVTHSHPDHFGSAGRLAHEAGAELVTERRFHTWLEPKAAFSARRGSTAIHSSSPADGGDHPGQAGPTQAGPTQAGPTRAGPTQAGPTQGGPVQGGGHGHHGHTGGPDACAELLLPPSADAGGDGADAGGEGHVADDDTGYFSIASRTTPWGGSPIPHLQRNIWMMRLARWHLLRYMRPPVPTRFVTGGDRLRLAGREWQVVHTPGHTGDHVCLFDPEAKLLISGDHVLPTITPHVPGLSPLADPLGSYLGSLQGLRSLGEVSVVLPAHGHPFPDLPGRIDDIVEHHEGRLRELRRISAAIGTATVVDLSKELFRPAVWGMMAESETYAHLEYLRLRGEAERIQLGGQAAYRLAPAPA